MICSCHYTGQAYRNDKLRGRKGEQDVEGACLINGFSDSNTLLRTTKVIFSFSDLKGHEM
jgi:hypothetical protein